VHHFERQLASPFPLLSAIAARTGRTETGIAVIVSRGSPETVLRGAESFGYQPSDGETDADAARRKTESFLAAIGGAVVARTDPARTGPESAAAWPSSRSRRAWPTGSGGAWAPAPPPSGPPSRG
jgi:hypothetical protein